MKNKKTKITQTNLTKKSCKRRTFLKASIAGVSGTLVSDIFNQSAEAAVENNQPSNQLGELSFQKNTSFFFPGEPLDLEEMRIVIMGSSSLMRKPQAGSSIFVELGNGDSFIFDAGPGVTANYTALGVPYSKMDKIFLTHLHCDHMSDLAYIYGFGPVYDRQMPLRIWGPSGTEPKFGTTAFVEALKAMCAWHIESISSERIDRGFEIDVNEFDYKQNPGIVYDRDGVTIKHFPAVHLKDGAVSYRLDWKGLSFVFSGDSRANNFMIENAQNVDLLIHQTVLPAEIIAKEFNISLQEAIENNKTSIPPEATGTVFAKTKPRLGVMTHLEVNENNMVSILDCCRKVYDGPVAIATDLMVFNVSKDKIRQRMAIVPNRARENTLKSSNGLTLPKKQPVEKLSEWLLDELIPPEKWRKI